MKDALASGVSDVHVPDGRDAVNVITMASLRESPEILDELLPWNAPKREGFAQRRLTMKELARKRQRVQ